METENIDALWSHLHCLAVLGRQGSFTAAATRLGISKAAMSQRIAALERAAGTPLVLRTTRSVRLTEAGERLADGTREAFDRIRESFTGVRELAGEPQGLLRITAPVAFARQQLMPCLPEFLRAHPRVRLELDMSDRLHSLAMEGFDLALRHTAAPPQTHVAWALARTRSVLVASPAYLERRGLPTVPADLAGHDCLCYPRPRDAQAWAFVRDRGGNRDGDEDGGGGEPGPRVTVPVGGPFAANNSEVLRDAATDGVGIALLPDFSARSALRAGRLVAVLPGWRSVDAFGERIYAIRPYSPRVPLAVGALVGHLRRAFAPGFAACGRGPATRPVRRAPPRPAALSRK